MNKWTNEWIKWANKWINERMNELNGLMNELNERIKNIKVPKFPGCTAKHLTPRCEYRLCTATASRVQYSLDLLYWSIEMNWAGFGSKTTFERFFSGANLKIYLFRPCNQMAWKLNKDQSVVTDWTAAKKILFLVARQLRPL